VVPNHTWAAATLAHAPVRSHANASAPSRQEDRGSYGVSSSHAGYEAKPPKEHAFAATLHVRSCAKHIKKIGALRACQWRAQTFAWQCTLKKLKVGAPVPSHATCNAA
jgi:hypothetical protein